MSVETTIEVYGVRESLAELRRIDPVLRVKAVNKIKAAGAELVQIGAARYTADTGLSGWKRTGRLGYDPGKVRKGVKIQVGGRTPRGANAFPIVTMVQANAGGALWDIAGLRGGSKGRGAPKGRPNFVDELNRRHGPAQRGLWRAQTEIAAKASDKLVEALEDVAAQVNRKLVA